MKRALLGVIVAGGLASTTHGVDLLVCGWNSSNVLRCANQDDCATFVGSGSGSLNLAHSIDLGRDGHLYVTSFGTNRVNRYDGASGAFIDAFVTAGAGGLSSPTDGIFGRKTEAAIKAFQSNKGVTADGIATPELFRMIQAERHD